jgi:hypothetical protein
VDDSRDRPHQPYYSQTGVDPTRVLIHAKTMQVRSETYFGIEEEKNLKMESPALENPSRNLKLDEPPEPAYRSADFQGRQSNLRFRLLDSPMQTLAALPLKARDENVGSTKD